MRLRIRLALFFAVLTSLTIALAFAVTLAVFHDAQQRALDDALTARAQVEAEELVLRDGRTLHIQQAPHSSKPTALSQLVKYGAVFDKQGKVIAQTNSFGDVNPSFATIDYSADQPLPTECFDFPWGRQVLRGTLAPVDHHPQVPTASLLLLAVSREDLDTDTNYLQKSMVVVFGAAVALASMFGLWFGGHTTRGIEQVAQVARRVAKGELDARVSMEQVRQDSETSNLATDLNNMVDRLSALISAERRFISHAAHELRSPLSALKGELELALRHPRDVEAYKQAINEALMDTQRLQALAEDLLMLARVGMSTVGATTEACSVQAIVAHALHASLANTRHDCQVDANVPDTLQVQGRVNDLARLLRNLIDNAVAHAPPGTNVRITAQRDGDSAVLVHVEDDGPGVASHIAAQIFDPFFRGDTERAESGAGLGLSIAREIARVNGGDLVLACPAHPTRFTARLRA